MNSFSAPAWDVDSSANILCDKFSEGQKSFKNKKARRKKRNAKYELQSENGRENFKNNMSCAEFRSRERPKQGEIRKERRGKMKEQDFKQKIKAKRGKRFKGNVCDPSLKSLKHQNKIKRNETHKINYETSSISNNVTDKKQNSRKRAMTHLSDTQSNVPIKKKRIFDNVSNQLNLSFKKQTSKQIKLNTKITLNKHLKDRKKMHKDSSSSQTSSGNKVEKFKMKNLNELLTDEQKKDILKSEVQPLKKESDESKKSSPGSQIRDSNNMKRYKIQLTKLLADKQKRDIFESEVKPLKKGSDESKEGSPSSQISNGNKMKKNEMKLIKPLANKQKKDILKSEVKPLKKESDESNEALRSPYSKISLFYDPSLSLRERMLHQLKSSRFRYINEQLYTSSTKDSDAMFRKDANLFREYHNGFKQQVEQWPMNPVNRIIKAIKRKPATLVVADFGCGDAKLAKSLPNKVHSFDLVALSDEVTVCDMAHTPLGTASVDICVFCLSLMGTNLASYLAEASRILKVGGGLEIAEVASRFECVDTFVKNIKKFGFILNNKDLSHNLFYFLSFRKDSDLKKTKSLPNLSLNPCLYKKR